MSEKVMISARIAEELHAQLLRQKGSNESLTAVVERMLRRGLSVDFQPVSGTSPHSPLEHAIDKQSLAQRYAFGLLASAILKVGDRDRQGISSKLDELFGVTVDGRPVGGLRKNLGGKGGR